MRRLAIVVPVVVIAGLGLMWWTRGSWVGELKTRAPWLVSVVRSLRPPPSPVTDVHGMEADLTGATLKGSPNARLALIEFTDFECPYCGEHARTVYADIQREFVETGRVLYVLRNLPLERRHSHALKAAEAAACAGEQGRFWEMHDALFAHQEALEIPDLHDHAKNIGVDLDVFDACLAEGQTTARVRSDAAEAARLGITATPTFLIGDIEASHVAVTKRISGSVRVQVFRDTLNSLLSQ